MDSFIEEESPIDVDEEIEENVLQSSPTLLKGKSSVNCAGGEDERGGEFGKK